MPTLSDLFSTYYAECPACSGSIMVDVAGNNAVMAHCENCGGHIRMHSDHAYPIHMQYAAMDSNPNMAEAVYFDFAYVKLGAEVLKVSARMHGWYHGHAELSRVYQWG